MKLLPTTFALLACSALPAQTSETATGWLRLFDGESLFGWSRGGAVQASVKSSILVIEPSSGGWLKSNAPFADFDLRMEFEADRSIDSGIFLRAPAGPQGGGYQVQIGDLPGDGFGTGSVVGAAKARKQRSSPGDWNLLEVSVRGSSVVVRLNGKETASARSFQAPAGYVGIEAPAGGSLRIRKLELLPVGATPLFNAKDLTGWRCVDPAQPKAPPAEWSVRDSKLHVEKGPGQLETELAWDDFVLQLEIRVNTIDPSRHPNSGVFFRGDRDVWWSGYESQVRNEFGNGDRTQPVDFGTGGIYGRQAARRVVSSDNEWFTMTVVASGRRMGVWIDGIQVSDYLDENEEGVDVKQGKARLLRGTISLQAHDPGTNLDFRNIRIASLPRVPGLAPAN